MFSVQGFHSYWTKPQIAKRGKVAMQDFEVLTMALSACVYRKLGNQMTMVTDSQGAKFLQLIHGDKCYTNILTSLDKVSGVNPTVFWGAGKNLAYELFPTPCLSIDLDAVVWGLPEFDELTTDLIVLHEDPLDWDCYNCSGELYGSLGFKSPFWDWSVAPYNVAFLLFNNPHVRTAYTSISQMVMENISRFYSRDALERKSKAIVKNGRHPKIFEQIFAEQQLLSMVAHRLHARVGAVSEIDFATDHLKANPFVTHLWGIKGVYRSTPELKDHLVAGLLNKLGVEYPEAIPLCRYVEKIYKRANREVKGHFEEGGFMFAPSYVSCGSAAFGQERLLEVLDVKGEVQVGDVCFDFRRPMLKGQPIVIGESIYLKEKASCVIKRGSHIVSVKCPDKPVLDAQGFARTKVVRKVS